MAHSSKHRAPPPPPPRDPPESSPPPNVSNPFAAIVALVLVLMIVGFAVLAHYSGRAESSPQQFAQSVSLNASAESGLIAVGTLAPLGSFEYETSPLVNRLAVVLRHAADAYLRHEISRDEASEVKAEAEDAYAVIAQATRLCDPAPHSGKCRGSREKVNQLLEQARAVVESAPDYSPGVSYSGH